MIITLDEAVRLLKDDQVVAIPTETVYGLAALYSSKKGVERIFQTKNRPMDNPLILHVNSAEEFFTFAKTTSSDVHKLIEAFWPGPLTLVVAIDPQMIQESVRASLPTAAFRIPSHPLMRKVISEVGPLVAPSANLSTRPSSTCARHIEEDFGMDFPVLDGGSCSIGVESTILIEKEGKWFVGRLGGISLEEIEKVIGYKPFLLQSEKKPLCPGSSYRHYAPKAQLRLGNFEEIEVDAVMGFEESKSYYSKPYFSLGSKYEPKEAFRRLYQLLRLMDEKGYKSVGIDTEFEKCGDLLTVYERLGKASS